MAFLEVLIDIARWCCFFIALFSTLLYFNQLFTDYINSKTMVYAATNEKDEKEISKMKLILCLIMAISWSLIILLL